MQAQIYPWRRYWARLFDISSFGTTPGKFLLGIKIRALSGKKISYTTGIKRGFLLSRS
ncbi:MAG: RDD family protein [Candidatus Atribacteria bacterium]|nr:RDD family protein [Candidatus Atribacteria bacterium]